MGTGDDDENHNKNDMLGFALLIGILAGLLIVAMTVLLLFFCDYGEKEDEYTGADDVDEVAPQTQSRGASAGQHTSPPPPPRLRQRSRSRRRRTRTATPDVALPRTRKTVGHLVEVRRWKDHKNTITRSSIHAPTFSPSGSWRQLVVIPPAAYGDDDDGGDVEQGWTDHESDHDDDDDGTEDNFVNNNSNCSDGNGYGLVYHTRFHNEDEEEEDEQEQATNYTPSPMIDVRPPPTASAVAESTECPICLDPFHDSDLVCRSKNKVCQHVFHMECMKQWLDVSCGCDCPVCRQPFNVPMTQQQQQISLSFVSGDLLQL